MLNTTYFLIIQLVCIYMFVLKYIFIHCKWIYIYIYKWYILYIYVDQSSNHLKQNNDLLWRLMNYEISDTSKPAQSLNCLLKLKSFWSYTQTNLVFSPWFLPHHGHHGLPWFEADKSDKPRPTASRSTENSLTTPTKSFESEKSEAIRRGAARPGGGWRRYGIF